MMTLQLKNDDLCDSPAYRQLGMIRDSFKGVPCIALTATATKTIVQDLVKNLKLQNPQSLSMSFDRPNIYYSVRLSLSLPLSLLSPPHGPISSDSVCVSLFCDGAVLMAALLFARRSS